jgi:hypothetical protein
VGGSSRSAAKARPTMNNVPVMGLVSAKRLNGPPLRSVASVPSTDQGAEPEGAPAAVAAGSETALVKVPVSHPLTMRLDHRVQRVGRAAAGLRLARHTGEATPRLGWRTSSSKPDAEEVAGWRSPAGVSTFSARSEPRAWVRTVVRPQGSSSPLKSSCIHGSGALTLIHMMTSSLRGR